MTIVTNGRRKFRSQTSDKMDRSKSRGGERQRREGEKEEDQTRERVVRKKMQVREKIGKVAKHCFSNLLWLRREKSRLANVAGAETSGEMGDEKLHAVVARSIFRSQNVQRTSFSENFCKLRCSKSARRRRCGEANFEAKMYKAHHSRSTFGS